MNRYPTNDEGLAILCRPSESFPEPLLTGELKDPWGMPYQYNSPGASGPFEVISYGANGRPGGEGLDADICSDKLKE
jgi:general secretion pathway protein G